MTTRRFGSMPTDSVRTPPVSCTTRCTIRRSYASIGSSVTAEPVAALNRTREVLLVWSGEPPAADGKPDSQRLAEGKP